MDTYEFDVRSELYGITTCVVDIATFLQGRRTFPCGDGTDRTLSQTDIREIKVTLKEIKAAPRVRG
jgi:hypothetical protein